ncbi:MAG: hypothetical protein GXO26_06755, partial [Crenarchaeota archaeon]|nr:hypothetical protein [Thermoproteota archaeon]
MGCFCNKENDLIDPPPSKRPSISELREYILELLRCIYEKLGVDTSKWNEHSIDTLFRVCGREIEKFASILSEKERISDICILVSNRVLKYVCDEIYKILKDKLGSFELCKSVYNYLNNVESACGIVIPLAFYTYLVTYEPRIYLSRFIKNLLYYIRKILDIVRTHNSKIYLSPTEFEQLIAIIYNTYLNVVRRALTPEESKAIAEYVRKAMEKGFPCVMARELKKLDKILEKYVVAPPEEVIKIEKGKKPTPTTAAAPAKPSEHAVAHAPPEEETVEYFTMFVNALFQRLDEIIHLLHELINMLGQASTGTSAASAAVRSRLAGWYVPASAFTRAIMTVCSGTYVMNYATDVITRKFPPRVTDRARLMLADALAKLDLSFLEGLPYVFTSPPSEDVVKKFVDKVLEWAKKHNIEITPDEAYRIVSSYLYFAYYGGRGMLKKAFEYLINFLRALKETGLLEKAWKHLEEFGIHPDTLCKYVYPLYLCVEVAVHANVPNPVNTCMENYYIPEYLKELLESLIGSG